MIGAAAVAITGCADSGPHAVGTASLIPSSAPGAAADLSVRDTASTPSPARARVTATRPVRAVPSRSPQTSAPSPVADASAPGCANSQIAVSATSDRNTYTSEPVTITVVVTNTGADPCSTPDQCVDSVVVRDTSGGEAWASRPNPSGACPYSSVTLLPGHQWSYPVSWDQSCQSAPCAPAARGSYRARGYWGGVASGEIAFSLS